MMRVEIKRVNDKKKGVYIDDEDDIISSNTSQEPNVQKTFNSQEINMCYRPTEEAFPSALCLAFLAIW